MVQRRIRTLVLIAGEGALAGLVAGASLGLWDVRANADLSHGMPRLAALRAADAMLTVVPPAILLAALLALVAARTDRSGRRWRRVEAAVLGIAAVAAAGMAAGPWRGTIFPLHYFSSHLETLCFAGAAIGAFLALIAVSLARVSRAEASIRVRAARLGLVLLGVVVAARAALGLAAAPASAPSVLLVSIDTLRADRLGALGSRRNLTPNLDRLIRAGLVFERATSPAPWTLPAHMSLFVSRLPWKHGVCTLGSRLAPGVATLAEHYRDRGYRTAAFTAGGFLNESYGFGQGFETFETFEHASNVGTEPIVAAALRWMRRDRDRPFFAFVHTYAPHVPYRHAELADRNDAGRMPGEFPMEYLDAIRRGELVLTASERKYVTDLYDGGVRYADGALAPLFDARVGDRVITVVVSDHGEDLWDHVTRRSPDHGHSLYEELVHVPVIISAPGIVRAGTRIRSRVSLVDVGPTLLALSGLPPDPEHQGRDLADVCPKGREPTEEPVFAEATRYGPERFAVTLDDVKAVVAPRTDVVDDITAAPLEVFDLATDPDERHPSSDVAASVTALVDALRVRAGGHAHRTPDDVLPASAELQDRLRKLGYVQ